MDISLSNEQNMKVAIVMFYNRKYGFFKPEGKWLYGKWQPSKREKQDCCRQAELFLFPSGYDDLYNHCKTLSHTCSLCQVSHTETEIYLEKIIKDKTWKPHDFIFDINSMSESIELFKTLL